MSKPVNLIKLVDVIDQFIADVGRRYSAPSTAAYTQALQLFQHHLRHDLKLAVPTLTIDELQTGWGESYLRLLQETRSPETEHLYSRVVLHFIQFVETAYERTLSSEEFAEFLDVTRRPKNHAIPDIPHDAVEMVLEFAASYKPPQLDHQVSDREVLGLLRDKAFLLTLAFTGLRVSEICGLRRQQFQPTVGGIGWQDNSQLPLKPSAVGAISAYLKARAGLDGQQSNRDLPLFARHDKRAGSRVLPISRWTGANIVELWVVLALPSDLRIQLDQAKQTITPHTFRHYFVLNALAQVDQDVRTAQTLARHGDRSTTRRYLRRLTQEPKA